MEAQPRVKTGIEGLDEILEGGFIPQTSILIEGPPGSGKTNLGIQILWNGIEQFHVPGILFSFEQRPEQLIRDARCFGWDLEQAISDDMLRIITTSPLKMQETFAGASSEIDDEIERACDEIQPRRALIDSITHFRRIAHDEPKLREIVYKFLNTLSDRGLTTFVTKEVTSDNDTISFEEYAVDASMRLHDTPMGGLRGNLRTLEVRKTRGHGHLSGRHPLFFGKGGIRIYPHRKPRPRPNAKGAVVERPRISTGVSSLDRLIEGGVPKKSSILIAGATGVGKSILAYHFILEGLRRGENGLIVTLNESPDRVAEAMAETGYDIEGALASGALTIHHEVPVDLCMEKLLWDIESLVKRHKVQRVVVDGLSDMETSVPDADRRRDYLFTLLKTLEDLNATVYLTKEIDAIAGGLTISDIANAYIVDGVIFMGFAEIESRMRRVISILKMWGTKHESELRELAMSEEGPLVGGKFAGLSGVMGGMPTGQYQETIEEIIQPLVFLRSFAGILTTAGLPEEKRQQAAAQIKDQTERVITFICEFHGIDPEKIGKQVK